MPNFSASPAFDARGLIEHMFGHPLGQLDSILNTVSPDRFPLEDDGDVEDWEVPDRIVGWEE